MTQPVISLKGLSRSFQSGLGEEVRILDNVDLDIEPGTFNVIRGDSGSGKTTLLRILGMLDTGFEGTYELGGIRVDGRPDWFLDEMRASNLGFIFQEGRLFDHMTLRRNVQIPLDMHKRGGASDHNDTINELEPSFFEREQKRGLNILDMRPGPASGGQKQRASIMRAIINRPSIILADEPTASLHGELKQEVVDHLRDLCAAGHTVIVVSHDHVFYGLGRQIELENGRLKELPAEPVEPNNPIAVAEPAKGSSILWGWRPRAPLGILLQQAIRETVYRPIFLSLILISLIVGVCQVSVFSSVIIGAEEFIDAKMTEGSRLNRVRIKPKAKDRAAEDRFPARADIGDWDKVDVVVPRRETMAVVKDRGGSDKTFSAMGLHPDDPEYRLLQFVAGGPFSDSNDLPEVILTSSFLPEVFDTSGLEDGSKTFDDFIGQEVELIVNRYNKKGKLSHQEPVMMAVAGIILNGEGGRQLYLPNKALLLFDRLRRDREGEFALPDGASPANWVPQEQIADMINFPWEDSLHVYSNDMEQVLPLLKDLSREGYKPSSDIWQFKWALDIQDTAWRIFLPLLVLIVAAVSTTVAANIFTSAKLRETELALWRVLGMRRGDLVLTQVLATVISVAIGAVAGLLLGSAIIEQTKSMLKDRAAEAEGLSDETAQSYDAIFAPVDSFFWVTIAAAIIIGILAAIYPAIRAAKTDPAKVLQS